LIFKKNNVLLTKARGFADGRVAARNDLFCYEGLTYDQYRGKLFSEQAAFWPAMSLHTPENGRRPVITYNQYFSFDLSTTVVFSGMLPLDDLIGYFVPRDMRDRSFVQIEGPDGLLYTPLSDGDVAVVAPGEMTLGGVRYRIWEETWMGYGLRVLVGVSTDVFDEYLQPIAGRVRLYIAIAVLVSIACAIAFAWYSFLPLKPVYRLLEASGQGGFSSVFRQIRLTMEREQAMRGRLNDEFKRMNDAMTSSALRHAISGDVLTTEEMRLLSAKNVFACEYFVLLFQYDAMTYEHIRALQACCYMHFGDAWGECLYYMPNEMALVLPAACVGAIDDDRSRDRFTEACGTEIRFGWSGPRVGIEQLKYAFMEAERYLYRVYHPDACGAPGAQDDISFKQFLSVTRDIQAGDEAGLAERLARIRSWMILDCPSLEQASVMLYNLRIAVAQADPNADVGLVNATELSQHVLEELASIRRWAMQLCKQNAERPTQADGDLSDQIVAYIREHFDDPDLCLNKLAAKYSLSESYVSLLIKRRTGESYAAFVNALRMNEAMRLLRDTDERIDQIMRRTGYAYKNTFYKAFKKTWKHPPNHFRGEDA
ncbi:MAG: helix-turn-helix transcriptional regulator, partial [Clostridiales bacterium]|nr:helix-turn-helix transcriptional regulator [Clostridiales bacterium]